MACSHCSITFFDRLVTLLTLIPLLRFEEAWNSLDARGHGELFIKLHLLNVTDNQSFLQEASNIVDKYCRVVAYVVTRRSLFPGVEQLGLLRLHCFLCSFVGSTVVSLITSPKFFKTTSHPFTHLPIYPLPITHYPFTGWVKLEIKETHSIWHHYNVKIWSS